MSEVHLHLLITHFPIVGVFFAIGLLAFGVLRKEKSLINAALVALLIVAILVLPTYFSGEGAEEVIENIDKSANFYLHEHERAGKIAMIATVITGVFAAISLFLTRKKESSLLPIITLIVALVAAVTLVRAGSYGGQIRHSEIRSNSTNMPTTEHSQEVDGD